MPLNKQILFVNLSISIYYLVSKIFLESYYLSLHTNNFYGWQTINLEKKDYGENKKKTLKIKSPVWHSCPMPMKEDKFSPQIQAWDSCSVAT